MLDEDPKSIGPPDAVPFRHEGGNGETPFAKRKRMWLRGCWFLAIAHYLLYRARGLGIAFSRYLDTVARLSAPYCKLIRSAARGSVRRLPPAHRLREFSLLKTLEAITPDDLSVCFRAKELRISELDVLRFGIALSRADASWRRWAPQPEDWDRMRDDLEAAAFVVCRRVTRTTPEDPIAALREAVAGRVRLPNGRARAHLKRAREILELADVVERRIA